MAEFLNGPEPGLTAAALVFLLLGLACLFLAVSQLRRRHLLRSGFQGTLSALLLAGAVLLILIGINLKTYQRLTYEKPVAELTFQQLGPQHFRARLSGVPGQPAGRYDLYGDEWQIDARILKWKPPATLLGLDARYRLERLGGRYRDIRQEREKPRAVYRLAPRSGLDLWELLAGLQSYLGWVDAYYGNATYLPMADGARYEVSLTQSGLVARPANERARQAVSRWQ
ncbi:MAG: hypothetical protein P8126_08560 [Gammaproteobacteria bacterium]